MLYAPPPSRVKGKPHEPFGPRTLTAHRKRRCANEVPVGCAAARPTYARVLLCTHVGPPTQARSSGSSPLHAAGSRAPPLASGVDGPRLVRRSARTPAREGPIL